MSARASGTQESTVAAVNSSVAELLKRMDVERGKPLSERVWIAAHMKHEIRKLRVLEGTLQDPASWQSVHNLIDTVDAEVERFVAELGDVVGDQPLGSLGD
jgi:hypothetical protein